MGPHGFNIETKHTTYDHGPTHGHGRPLPDALGPRTAPPPAQDAAPSSTGLIISSTAATAAITTLATPRPRRQLSRQARFDDRIAEGVRTHA